MCVLEKYLKAIEWNIKNLAKMTEDDWSAFSVVEDQFQAWIEQLPEQDRKAIEVQVKMVVHSLKTFEGARFRGIW